MKKFWKKSTMSILSLGLAASVLAACGDKEETGNAEEFKGKITIWDGPRWADEDENKFHWMEEKIKEYEAKHDGIKIDLVQVPWAEMGDKLGVSITGKAWPDIAPVDISGSSVNIDHIEQGVIESLDPFFDKEAKKDFYDNALEAYTHDGKLYGIPSSITLHTMLLNLDLFKEAGVEPPKDGKWTYDEFLDTAEKLTFDRDDDGKTDVYGFSTYIMPGYYEAWPFFYKNGGSPLNEDMTEFTFDSPETVQAIQDLADLKLKHKVAPETHGGNDVGGTFQSWANEEQRTVAMQPWATWAIGAAQSTYPTNFMVAEYPSGDSDKPVTIGGVGGWIMMHQKDVNKKAAVADFMKYISSAEEQYTMSQNYGVFPARISAADMEPFKENPEMARAMEMSDQVVMLPRHTEWRKIDEAIQNELQLVFNGEKTAEQAMADAKKAVDKILE
ncbi:ABC transporter substrate-binding protein [Sporosarcina sp. Sa2YVA2]|uniref:ABC transporter substrate-binding protein n=1 Tax=Sporosarcina quadrami TaxID=2762234 RepID=A0ABR8U9Q6_9BACL|nr:ABC transporter substrate-binding protein [Sporosarcina quadrami]MBD7984773.1 ABC transporter substrate-binding protein [Sporosarcina quadrami]